MADEKEAVMAEEKKSSNNKIVIILIIVIVLLIAGGVTFFILNGKKPAESGTTSGKQIPLEVNAQVLTSDQNEAWNSMLEEMKDNEIPIRYSPTAASADGENFLCEIGNPISAPHYMYVDLYSDSTLSEEIYLSGLLAPGQGITSFKTSKKFPQGETDTVLVITTVDDDKETLISQTMVVLTLSVNQ